MSTDAWVNYVLIAVVLIVIAVAFILVRRSQLANRDESGGSTRVLDRGWQFYFTPTTLEPPGTVFRIDKDRRRYIVETLAVELQAGEEAFGEHKENVTANLGMLAKFLGLKGLNLNIGANKMENLVFKIDNPEREYVNDVDLDKVLTPFLSDLTYRADNRYFVIRESRKATGIMHTLTRGQVENLGGEAALSESAAVEGTLFKSERSGEFSLQKTFDAPMRVMFLPEEIRPISRGPASEKPDLGRVPVSEPLVWEDA